ncbi:MAG TPA: transposase [Thermoanaerobaculaceae bacterium]|nr:transposase [Thermoanaerobaculaceae bacterium]
MSESDLTQYVQQLRLDGDALADAQVREIVGKVLNLVETVVAENRRLQAENQRLEEVIRQLQGKRPSGARPSRPPAQDVSSEKERRQRASRRGRSRRADRRSFRDIRVDEEVVRPVDPACLPADATFVGYDEVIVQDVRIQSHNIRYRLEVWDSPSQGRVRGELPPGVKGEYGPELKALLVSLKYVAGTSLPRAHEFVEHCGVVISPASVSNIVRDAAELFHAEKAEIFRAGLAATTYQHIDDTSARVGGEFWHTHIVCNPFHSTYFTTPHKDRMTIVDLLRGGPRTYRFSDLTQQLMKEFRVPRKWRRKAATAPQDRDLSEAELESLIEPWCPSPRPACLERLREAAALASYRARPDRVRTLICDDAKQFKHVTDDLGLCWIHQGRHYKELSPVVPSHQQQLEAFRTRYWDLYGELLEYQGTPTPARADELREEFDQLCATRTGYEALDQRIAATSSKKASLLTVLNHPETPLHNNPAELGERVAARRRDVSLHCVKAEGARGMDTFTTIVQTAKKLAVNGYEYLRDRISGVRKMPSLAGLIRQRSRSPPTSPPCPSPTDQSLADISPLAGLARC